MRDLNAFLPTLCAREQLHVLDFEKVFAPDRNGRKAEFSADDLSHVNPAGYRALTEYAAVELSRKR